jgi:hypothetical protein
VVDDGFLSAEFIRRKMLEGASPNAPNFSAVQEHCPPEILTTRYSLFAVVLAEVGGYETQSLLKQANGKLRVARSRKSLSPQLSTRNAQPN